MILTLTGSPIRRLLVMACIKVLKDRGTSLLITDDSYFARIASSSEDGSSEHLGTTRVICTTEDPEAVFQQIEMTEDDFDNVIYSFPEMIPKGTHGYVYMTPETLIDEEILNSQSVKAVPISFENRKFLDKLKGKKIADIRASAIVIDGADVLYWEGDCERLQYLPESPNKEFNSTFSHRFKDLIGLGENEILQSLQRGWDL